MTKKIKILTLAGCETCANLKNKLETNGLAYSETECGRRNQFCDEIEHITKCDMYPIVIINDSILLCLTNDYSMIGNIKRISNNTQVAYTHSIDNMINFINKL